MRENSFYPPTPPPPGLARPSLSVPGPFQSFSHTAPRLQGYQRPQSQVSRQSQHGLLVSIVWQDVFPAAGDWQGRQDADQGGPHHAQGPLLLLPPQPELQTWIYAGWRELKVERMFNFCVVKGPGQQPRFDMPPEETADLEELEEFSKMFKQKRIKLGNYSVQAGPCLTSSPPSQVTPRETSAWPWENSTATTSLKQQSQDLKLSISLSRTCAS